MKQGLKFYFYRNILNNTIILKLRKKYKLKHNKSVSSGYESNAETGYQTRDFQLPLCIIVVLLLKSSPVFRGVLQMIAS